MRLIIAFLSLVLLTSCAGQRVKDKKHLLREDMSFQKVVSIVGEGIYKECEKARGLWRCKYDDGAFYMVFGKHGQLLCFGANSAVNGDYGGCYTWEVYRGEK